MSNDLLKNWQGKSAARRKTYKTFLQRAGKNQVLGQLPRLHEKAFEQIDCTQCANCCRNYSPRFKTPDIKRIAKHLRLKESDFIATYLRLDEDGDYVVKSTPCPFLEPITIARSMNSVPPTACGFPTPMKTCCSNAGADAQKQQLLPDRILCTGKFSTPSF